MADNQSSDHHSSYPPYLVLPNLSDAFVSGSQLLAPLTPNPNLFQALAGYSAPDYYTALTPAPASHAMHGLDILSNPANQYRMPEDTLLVLEAHAAQVRADYDAMKNAPPPPPDQPDAAAVAPDADTAAQLAECMRLMSTASDQLTTAARDVERLFEGHARISAAADTLMRAAIERQNTVAAARQSLMIAYSVYTGIAAAVKGAPGVLPVALQVAENARHDLEAQAAHEARPQKPLPARVNSNGLVKALRASASSSSAQSPIVQAPSPIVQPLPVNPAIAAFSAGKRVPLAPVVSRLADKRLPMPPAPQPAVRDEYADDEEEEDQEYERVLVVDSDNDDEEYHASTPIVVRGRSNKRKHAAPAEPVKRSKSGERVTLEQYCHGVPRAPPATTPLDVLFSVNRVAVRSGMVRHEWATNKAFVIFVVDADCNEGAAAYTMAAANKWTKEYVRDEAGPTLAAGARIILNMSANVPIMEYWPRMLELLDAVPGAAWDNIELCIEADRLRINELDFKPLHSVPHLRAINDSQTEDEARRWGCLSHLVDLKHLRSLTLCGQIPWSSPNVAGPGGKEVEPLAKLGLDLLESITLCHDLYCADPDSMGPGSWVTYCGINQAVTGTAFSRRPPNTRLRVHLPDSLNPAFLESVARRLMATRDGAQVTYQPGSDAMGLAIAHTIDDILAPQLGGRAPEQKIRATRLVSSIRFLALRPPTAAELSSKKKDRPNSGMKKQLDELSRPTDVFKRLRARYVQ